MENVKQVVSGTAVTFKFNGADNTTVPATSDVVYKNALASVVQVTLEGTGPVSASLALQGTIDEATARGERNWWSNTIEFTPSGSDLFCVGLTQTDPFKYLRVVVGAVSAGATLTVQVGG